MFAITGAVKCININVVINGADPCEIGVKQEIMSSRIEPAFSGEGEEAISDRAEETVMTERHKPSNEVYKTKLMRREQFTKRS